MYFSPNFEKIIKYVKLTPVASSTVARRDDRPHVGTHGNARRMHGQFTFDRCRLMITRHGVLRRRSRSRLA